MNYFKEYKLLTIIVIIWMIGIIYFCIHYYIRDYRIDKYGKTCKALITRVMYGKGMHVHYEYHVKDSLYQAYYGGVGDDEQLIGDSITIYYDPKNPSASKPAYYIYPQNPLYYNEVKKALKH